MMDRDELEEGTGFRNLAERDVREVLDILLKVHSALREVASEEQDQ
jgi:hypothetical protein